MPRNEKQNSIYNGHSEMISCLSYVNQQLYNNNKINQNYIWDSVFAIAEVYRS